MPPRAPFQPAWAAPTIPASGSASSTGAQSAVRTAQMTPGVAVTVASPSGRSPFQPASATPGVICAVLTADCAPVLLADPEAGVVGAAHAGWKGALGGIVHSTVAAMEALGARPERIAAVIGPCIAQASYKVGADFQDRFDHHDPGSGRFFAPGPSADKRLFDLPAYVLWRLDQAGVGEAAWTGEDTRTDEARFFSNRRAYLNGEPDFGRLMSAITPI